MAEIVAGIAGLLVLVLLIAIPVMLVVTLVKVQRIDGLARRIEQLERRLGQFPAGPLPAGQLLEPAQPPVLAERPPLPIHAPAPMLGEAVRGTERPTLPAAFVPPRRDAINWEDLIGRKALGWVAVVVLLFATAFFLRYAFENYWIGPLGRVSLGVVAGLALVEAGRRQQRLGWRLLAQMLTSGGIVLLYLSMYGAFGFYHLIGQRAAGLFLLLLVAEAALLALAYEAPAIALMAVIGGLLTPLLMHSEHDQYASLFTYLAVLNAGVVWLLVRRAWPAIGTVSLLGTQLLFWLWYEENYHPEKLAWALGFQAVVYGLFLLHGLLANRLAGRRAGWEDVARTLASAGLWSAAAYVLLDDDYHAWLGSLAVLMAALYALTARYLLTSRVRDDRLLLAAVGIATGFLALAIPLQADAPWVALGWAAEAGVLWWAGVRIRSLPLRLMADAMVALAVSRMLFVDTPQGTRAPFTPIFNDYALPALATVACLSAALMSTRGRLGVLSAVERVAVTLAAVGCVLLLWLIVSIDLWGYFDALSATSSDSTAWFRMAQMSLSAWWSVYAAIVLAVGFRTRQALLRWTALGLFGLTVLKVFLFDMSGLDQIYRIVAFFVLAVLLGIAAWAYQRLQPDRAIDKSL